MGATKQQLVEAVEAEQRDARLKEGSDVSYLRKRVELTEIKYAALQADFLRLAAKVSSIENLMERQDSELLSRATDAAMERVRNALDCGKDPDWDDSDDGDDSDDRND